jgi:hypothetical protein
MEILKTKKPRMFISILICAVMLIQLTAFVSTIDAWVPVPPIPATKLDMDVDVGSRLDTFQWRNSRVLRFSVLSWRAHRCGFS